MGQHTLYTAVMSGHMTKPDTKENQCCEMACACSPHVVRSIISMPLTVLLSLFNLINKWLIRMRVTGWLITNCVANSS